MLLFLFFLFVFVAWGCGFFYKDLPNRRVYIYTTLWVIAGTFAGLIGFIRVIGARVINDNDMHGWVFYAAPVGAILGGITASAIASHFRKNYKSACIKCLFAGASFLCGHYKMLLSSQEYISRSEAFQEVEPAVIWCVFLILYGLFLMLEIFNRKSS